MTNDSNPGRGPSWWWVLPAVLLVVAGAASLYAQHVSFRAAPPSSDWRDAGEYVLEHLAAEDVIRVHPAWNEDGLPYLTEAGDQLSRQLAPVPGDLYGYDQLWIVSERARVDDALARLPFETPATEPAHFGDVSVVHFPLPDPGYRWGFLQHLDRARVERVGPNNSRTCKRWSERDRRWDCGSRDKWQYVGETLQEVGDEPHRCIWAHPVAGEEFLRVTFPDVPLRQSLRIRAGLSLRDVRKNRESPLNVRVRLGDETEVDHTFEPPETTWRPFDIDTGEFAGEQTDVSIEVRAKDSSKRQFCFNGWVVDS